MDKQDFTYTILELRKMLNIKDKYKLYGDFKKRILDIAKEQINSSDSAVFNIDFEEIKTGKAVTSIKFFILKKGQFNYYQQNNLLPNYQLDKIKKECAVIIKTHDKNDILYVLSERILLELKAKSPARFAVLEYYSTIERIKKDRNE
jgi:plasmid replication initiation protein